MMSAFENKIEILDRRQTRMFAVMGAALFLLLATFVPTSPAHAWLFDTDLLDSLVKLLIIPVYEFFCEACGDAYKNLAQDLGIVENLKNIDGFDDVMAPVYAFISTAHDSVISPMAKQILTLVFMFRLLAITKVAENNDMSPLIPKLVVTCVGYFLMLFLVDNAAGIFTLGFELLQEMLEHISSSAASTSLSWDVTNREVFDDADSVDILILAILGMGFQTLIAWIAMIVVSFIYYGKIITLYVQAFLSPIAIALLGVESTRQWGMGFIKNVSATFLSFTIMYFILAAFPLIQAAVLSGMGAMDLSGGQSMGDYLVLAATKEGGGVIESIKCLVPLQVVNILLIFTIVKSSAMAKEILGG